MEVFGELISTRLVALHGEAILGGWTRSPISDCRKNHYAPPSPPGPHRTAQMIPEEKKLYTEAIVPGVTTRAEIQGLPSCLFVDYPNMFIYFVADLIQEINICTTPMSANALKARLEVVCQELGISIIKMKDGREISAARQKSVTSDSIDQYVTTMNGLVADLRKKMKKLDVSTRDQEVLLRTNLFYLDELKINIGMLCGQDSRQVSVKRTPHPSKAYSSWKHDLNKMETALEEEHRKVEPHFIEHRRDLGGGLGASVTSFAALLGIGRDKVDKLMLKLPVKAGDPLLVSVRKFIKLLEQVTEGEALRRLRRVVIVGLNGEEEEEVVVDEDDKVEKKTCMNITMEDFHSFMKCSVEENEFCHFISDNASMHHGEPIKMLFDLFMNAGLFFIPVSTTHCLAPNDQAVNALFKNGIRARIERYRREHKTLPSVYQIICFAIQTWCYDLTDSAVQASFDQCGLANWPEAAVDADMIKQAIEAQTLISDFQEEQGKKANRKPITRSELNTIHRLVVNDIAPILQVTPSVLMKALTNAYRDIDLPVDDPANGKKRSKRNYYYEAAKLLARADDMVEYRAISKTVAETKAREACEQAVTTRVTKQRVLEMNKKKKRRDRKSLLVAARQSTTTAQRSAARSCKEKAFALSQIDMAQIRIAKLKDKLKATEDALAAMKSRGKAVVPQEKAKKSKKRKAVVDVVEEVVEEEEGEGEQVDIWNPDDQFVCHVCEESVVSKQWHQCDQCDEYMCDVCKEERAKLFCSDDCIHGVEKEVIAVDDSEWVEGKAWQCHSCHKEVIAAADQWHACDGCDEFICQRCKEEKAKLICEKCDE